MNNLVLKRSSDSIVLFPGYDKGDAIQFSETTNRTGTLNFVGGTITVFVEWAAPGHGTAELQLIDEGDNDKVIDTLKFHTFHSIVIAFGGNNQSPIDENRDGRISDPRDKNVPADLEGIFDIAQDLYESGWDVFPFDEEVDNRHLDTPHYEVVTAVDNRSVEHVAIFGYSHGGGATHKLAERLNPNYNVDFAAFIDAVDHLGSNQENDFPNGVDYLLNIYQENGFLELGGGPIEAGTGQTDGTIIEEINVTTKAGWNHGLNHYLIDDDDKVKSKVKTELEERISR